MHDMDMQMNMQVLGSELPGSSFPVDLGANSALFNPWLLTCQALARTLQIYDVQAQDSILWGSCSVGNVCVCVCHGYCALLL